MKSEYTSTPTGDEIEANDLELQDMVVSPKQSQTIHMTQEKQRQSSRQSSWKGAFHSTKTRNIWLVMLMVFLAGAGIIGYVYHHSSRTSETSLVGNEDTKNTFETETENEQKIPKKSSSMENNDNDNDNSERLPQLRAYSYNDDYNEPEIVGHMNLYFRKPYDDGIRRPYERIRVPVARYSIRDFPLMGPFISVIPWIPIYADRNSKQTIIYSKRSGAYVLPWLINRFGTRYSIAELIASGHVSLSSSGLRPNRNIDMGSLFQSAALVGPRIPRISRHSGGFQDGFETDYGSFSIPRQNEVVYDFDRMVESEEEEDTYRPPPPPKRRPSYKKKNQGNQGTSKANSGDTITQSTSGAANVLGNIPYFQASNTKDQLGSMTGKIVAYDGIDGFNGYTLYKNGTYVNKAGGLFFGMYACQVGSPRAQGEGEIHIWGRPNNQDDPNSNSIQTIRRGTTTVLVYTTVFKTPASRKSALAFSAIPSSSCTTLGLIATDIPTEPVIPSIISAELQIGSLNNPPPYATLSSLQNQLGPATTTPVTLNAPGDSNRVTITGAGVDGSIVFQDTQLYFAVAAGQVGRTTPGTTDLGEVHLWWALNGAAVEDSNTIQTVRKGSTGVLITQLITQVNPGDKLQIMYSSTNSDLGLIVSSPANEPVVPSMIFSTFAIGTSVPYAQFSSRVTQTGCVTPQAIQFEQTDGVQGMTNSIDTLVFQETGTYFVMAAAQVASPDKQGIGDLHLWTRVNGVDVPNSNTIQSIYKEDTAVLVCQSVGVMRAGDKLQVMFSTDMTSGTLAVFASHPAGEPWVPSIIFSAFKTSYTQAV